MSAVNRVQSSTVLFSFLAPAYQPPLHNHLFSHMLLFRLISFIRATGPLLVHEKAELSVVLDAPVSLDDVICVIALGDVVELLYSPSM